MDAWLHPRTAQQGFDLGGKAEASASLCKEEWLYTDAVAREKQRLTGRIPHGERKNPVEMQDAVLSPLQIGVEHNLGIRLRPQDMSAPLQCTAQLGRVVDLPVVDNRTAPPALRPCHRLKPVLDVNDRQTRVNQRRISVLPDAALIRPSALHRGKHPERGLIGARRADHTGNSAHSIPSVSSDSHPDLSLGNICADGMVCAQCGTDGANSYNFSPAMS